MSAEEFLMYLTAGQVRHMLRQEFGRTGAQGRPQDSQ